MSSTNSTGVGRDLCRVTVIAPNSRMDLALPNGVPLADLLPALLRSAGGGLAEAGLTHGGWAVQRLGESPLDTALSVDDLGVHDGEILYLRPRRDQLPETAFDDVVDAIAVALADRADRWRPAMTRPVALIGGAVSLVLGLVVLCLSGPHWTVPAVAAGGLTVGLLVAAGAMSRGVGDGLVGALLGVAAIPYGFLGGLFGNALFGPAGHGFDALLTPPDVVVAAAAAVVVAALAGVLVAAPLPVFLASGLVAVFGLAGGLIALAAAPAGAAGCVLAVALALTPSLPMLSYRIAGLPLPFIPSTAQDLRGDTDALPGADTLRRAVVADGALTGLLAGTALVAAGALAVLGLRGGWAALSLAGVGAGLLCLRARLFTGRAQRLWLLGAGGVGVVAVIVRLATPAGGPGGLAVALLPLLALVVVLLAAAVRDADRKRGPWAARLADTAELLGNLAVVPLALVGLGVYDYVRALWG